MKFQVKYCGFIIIDMIFFGAVMAVTMVAFHDGSRRTFVGILCATFTVIMYASPLTVVVSYIFHFIYSLLMKSFQTSILASIVKGRARDQP